MKVIDKKGKWYMNMGEHRIADYERQATTPGSEMVILEPGEATKIELSGYLKGQPTIKRCADPITGELPEADEAEAETAEAEKPADKPAGKK